MSREGREKSTVWGEIKGKGPGGFMLRLGGWERGGKLKLEILRILV